MKNRRVTKWPNALVLGFTALLAFGGCQDRDFLNVNTPKAVNRLVGCRCPDGFTMNPGADGCSAELTADPTGGPGALITIGDTDLSYLSWPSFFADATGTTNWPLNFEPNHQATDSLGGLVPELQTVSLPFWQNRVLSADRISIRSDPQIWHSKTVCINLPTAQTYSMLIGADNFWHLKIDGVEFAKCEDPSNDYCHTDARFISEKFNSGKHLVELKYYDEGGDGALWFELYTNSLASLQNAAQESDLNILFTTKSLVGQNWDYDGEACPPGYAYDTCSNDHKCTKLEKTGCL